MAVSITNSQINALGPIGLNPVSVNFNAGSASLLLVIAARSNNAATGPAAFTFGGQSILFTGSLSLPNVDAGTCVDVGILPNPPTGSQALIGEGPKGYFGSTNVMLVGLTGTSGVAGVRASGLAGGTTLDVPLGTKSANSEMLAFVACMFSKNTMGTPAGWTLNQSSLTDSIIYSWIYSITSDPGSDVVFTAGDYSNISAIVLEFLPSLAVSPNNSGTGAASFTTPTSSSVGNFVAKLTPVNQEFHVYWESWLDQPQKPVSLLQPDDFYLARLPLYVDVVHLSFCIPLCTYSGVNSNIKQTVGLNFPGSVALFQKVLNLARKRNPNVEFYMAVQQNTPEEAHNEPYDPNGWGGMTSYNTACMLRFMQDMGLTGLTIDYECLSPIQTAERHCQTDPDTGVRFCYTDTEQVATIKAIRAGIPRPYKVILDGQHVGCYGYYPYQNATPLGYNSGYNLCLTRDLDALACLDAIHVMTYDAGSEYDPRIAVRAFRYFFPDMPLYIGLRVGPKQYQDVKQTIPNIIDYCNTSMMLGLKGCHMYSMMWDVIYPGKDNPDFDPPFGDYGPNFPDGNLAAAAVAMMFNLPGQDKRLDNDFLSRGTFGPLM